MPMDHTDDEYLMRHGCFSPPQVLRPLLFDCRHSRGRLRQMTRRKIFLAIENTSLVTVRVAIEWQSVAIE